MNVFQRSELKERTRCWGMVMPLFGVGPKLRRIVTSCALLPFLAGGAFGQVSQSHIHETATSSVPAQGPETATFIKLSGVTTFCGKPENGWTSPGIVVSPGAREVAVFPCGVKSPRIGKALVVGAGLAQVEGLDVFKGVLFQEVGSIRSLLDSPDRPSEGAKGLILPHDDLFVVGDWGQKSPDSPDVKYGALCALLDSENRPIEFWKYGVGGGLTKLQVPSPSQEGAVPFLSKKFPLGGLCGWSDGSGEGEFLAIVLEMTIEGESGVFLFTWSGRKWSKELLYSKQKKAKPVRWGAVIPADIRLAWTGRTFGALLAVAGDGIPASLQWLDSKEGLLQLKVESEVPAKGRLDSFHIIPNGASSSGSGGQTQFSVLHSVSPGFPNFPIANRRVDTIPVLHINLGSEAPVLSRLVSLGSFWPQGIRVHSVFRWESINGEIRALISGQTHFGFIAGVLGLAPGGFEMKSAFHVQGDYSQLLGSYSVVQSLPEVDLIVAPNLCFGTINETPSDDPLTVVSIDRKDGRISVDEIEASRFISSKLRVAR